MSWEVRPEPPGRAAVLWAAQRELQRPVFEALLRQLDSCGELRACAAADGPASGWALLRPAGVVERLRSRLYFSRSLSRATVRWLKHVLTFEGWLDYIARKASRHSGESIELTPRERRWPLVFLWGRVFRYLWQKNRRAV
jgi:hypothetical protein